MIQKLLDDILLKEQENRRKVGSGLWKPSMLGRCFRSHYWARADTKQTDPPDLRTLRIFRAGHLFHEFIQQFIPEAEKEVIVKSENIMGYADVVGKDCVYDIKSQHSRAFHYMANDKYDVKKERYSNWLQVSAYAQILKKPRVCLVFVSKDDLCIKEYADDLKNWEGELAKEYGILNHAWKIKQLPPANPRAYGGKECSYCPYKTLCKGEKNEHSNEGDSLQE
jgi:hypothetical protein